MDRGRSKHDVHHLALSCWKMAFDRPLRSGTIKMSEIYQSAFKLPSIRTKNLTKICRVSRRFHHDLALRATTIPMNVRHNGCPSHHTRRKAFYADIECKQATCSLAGATRQAYGYQNIIRRTGARLKRRHCTIPDPALSFDTPESPSLSILHFHGKPK